jgi:hypothetical protein
MLDWVKDMLESLRKVVVYNKEQKETEARDAAERPRSYGFEYSDDEDEEEVPQVGVVRPTPAPVPTGLQYPLTPPQDWSITSKPTSIVNPCGTSASPANSSTDGHTPHPRLRSRPTWTPTNTPSPSNPFDPNPPAPSAPGTSPGTLPSNHSIAGHTSYPRPVAHTACSMTSPPLILRSSELLPMPPTPHHASGLLGPSPAPKRMGNHFSPEDIHTDIAIREALFKKPGRPVTSREGMFGSMMGSGESVGEAGMRRVRLMGGWRYVPVGEGGDGEHKGEDERHRRNVFKEVEKVSPVMSEKARGKQKAVSDEERLVG